MTLIIALIHSRSTNTDFQPVGLYLIACLIDIGVLDMISKHI